MFVLIRSTKRMHVVSLRSSGCVSYTDDTTGSVIFMLGYSAPLCSVSVLAFDTTVHRVVFRERLEVSARSK